MTTKSRFRFDTPAWADNLGWTQPQYYRTIQCADIVGNGRAQILARSAVGIVGSYFPKNVPGNPMHLGAYPIRLPSGPSLSDADGWDHPQYYSTIQFADIDGDGHAEMIARSANGLEIFQWSTPADKPDGPSGTVATRLVTIPHWTDTDGGDQPSQYSTIQCADIDGDGQAEIVGRFSGGIRVIKYNSAEKYWTIFPILDHWTDEGIGNDNPEQYYLTIQCADIDGDGQAEILGRYYDGIEFFKYTPNASTPWTQLTNFTDWTTKKGWDDSAYYLTIQCADVDGDGQAEVIGRAADGIQVWKYDPTNTPASWRPLTSPQLDGWSNEGCGDDNPEQYYLTIQCADIDGDGQAEILGRYSDGIEFFKYTPKASTPWTRLPYFTEWTTEAGWDHPQYYLTIQCADIDGDGQAEVIGRAAGGIEVWKYDKMTRGWVELAPSYTKVPFPSFTGEELTAFIHINKFLLPNWTAPHPNIRAEYGGGGNPSGWETKLSKMPRPQGVSSHAWEVVKRQLLLEFSYVNPVRTYFSHSTTLITDLEIARKDIVQNVKNSVAMKKDDSSSSIGVILANMILGILDAIAIAVSDGVGVAAGMFASTMGAAMSFLPGDGTTAVQTKVNQLDSWLLTQFTHSLNANGSYLTEILGNPYPQDKPLIGDWGLLQTLGILTSKGGPWEGSQDYISNARQ